MPCDANPCNSASTNASAVAAAIVAFAPADDNARVEAIVSEMMKDAGVRLPGTRRRELVARHQVTGITIPETLATELEQLGG